MKMSIKQINNNNKDKSNYILKIICDLIILKHKKIEDHLHPQTEFRKNIIKKVRKKLWKKILSEKSIYKLKFT